MKQAGAIRGKSKVWARQRGCCWRRQREAGSGNRGLRAKIVVCVTQVTDQIRGQHLVLFLREMPIGEAVYSWEKRKHRNGQPWLGTKPPAFMKKPQMNKEYDYQGVAPGWYDSRLWPAPSDQTESDQIQV